VEAYMLRVLKSMGAWTVGSVGAEAWRLFDETMGPQALQSAADLGTNLVDAVKAAEPIDDPERDAFQEMMKQLITMQKDNWPYEYEYWQSKGRL